MQILLDETIEIESIRFIDMIGIRYEIPYTTEERLVSFEVPPLAAGVYWISFKMDGDYFVQKFVVGR